MITGRFSGRLRRITTGLLLPAILVVALAAPPARAADAGLVLEALGVLRTRYVDQVDPVALINAAIGGLRQALSSAGIQADVAEIAQGTPVGAARRDAVVVLVGERVLVVGGWDGTGPVSLVEVVSTRRTPPRAVR